MSKGLIELPSTIFGTLIGVAAVVMFLVLLGSNAGQVSAAIQSGISRVIALDTAHAVELCLAGGGPAIRAETLAKVGNSLQAYAYFRCGLEIPDNVGGRVRDLETGKEWGFSYERDSKKRSQSVAVVIADKEERHVGMLTVQIP